MTKLLSLSIFIFLLNASSFAFWNSLFPEIKYSNAQSEQILDLVLGEDSIQNISVREEINIAIDKQQADKSFNDPNTKIITLTPTRLDTCSLLIDLMSSFYLTNIDKDVRLIFKGLKSNLDNIMSSNKNIASKKVQIVDNEVHVLLTKSFFKQHQEKLSEGFNFCTTSQASSILINKNKQLSQLREVSIRHNSIFDENRSLESKSIKSSNEKVKIIRKSDYR